MPYWKCFYHITWATKGRQPLIVAAYESVIFAAIESKCSELRCHLLAINSVSDHVHIALNIPPSKSVSDVVGQIKGASAHAVNIAYGNDGQFLWQEGYGVLTFGEKVLSQVRDYILRQKEHHRDKTTNSHMERIDE